MTPDNPPSFEARPPAKINLTLEILGRRPDGYHELRSTFLRVGLSDRLTVRPGNADGSDALTITGLPGASVRDNLVLRAIDALRARMDVDLPPLDVTLEKRIPVAGGLGGGSSDCASMIRLAQACWGVGLAPEEESALGGSLGSDVPFFLSEASAALVEGRGEHVTPVPAPTTAALLVTPHVALSTAAVFARYDEIDGVTDTHGNDLWPAAASLEPSLPAVRAELEGATDRVWLMSGSGPTMFAFYASSGDAADAAKALVAERFASLENALIHAVDLVGPDPAWRYP